MGKNVMAGAKITAGDSVWTLENEVVKTVISFSDGSVDMTEFYNRTAEKEYLTGEGERSLFFYDLGKDGCVSANDRGWKMESDAVISEIELYDRNWGKKLELTVTREVPVKLQVTLVFEIYHEDAGVRYQCLIKNLEEKEVTIEKSDVLRLNFPKEAHTAYYVPNMIWEHTNGSLAGTRNCVMVYESGDGWSLSPEINWETDGAEGNPPFGGIHAWADGETCVRFSTNPEALQLVLFPGEEMEYLAVNLTVFKGDELDGRMRVERHFRKRYKFWNPSTVLCINDWEWYSGGKRNDDYYRNVVVPKALAAGVDQIDVDDLWNVDRDSAEPLPEFTTDLKSLSEYINSKGLRIGYWFSVTGGFHDSGRDLADWSNIEFKLDQMENTLIGKYNSQWCQIDLKHNFQNPEVTSYSHPSDSVYRKNVNLRKYMNHITHKYPDFLVQPTNEIDNNQGRIPLTRNNGLIHMADNGNLCAHGEFESREISPWIAFNSFGYFPMCGCFQYFGERFEQSSEWLYMILLGRDVAIYRALEEWDEGAVALMKKFNDWRKEEHINSLLCEGVLPVEAGNPWVWMNVNKDQTEALLFVIDQDKESDRTYADAKLRWLDKEKTYLIRDISLNDQGEFACEELGEYQGETLKEKGFRMVFAEGTSKAKAYWIREK